MAQRDYVAQAIKLKHKAIFNLDELYKLMYRWFDFNGYFQQETEYRDSDEEGGKHLEIRWYAEKKVDDYIKFAIEPSFIVIGLTKVEVEREGGIKAATNKGEVEIRFDAYIVKDYDDKWTGPVSRLFREIYDRFIIKKRLEDYEALLQTELYKLIDNIKAFLNVHRF